MKWMFLFSSIVLIPYYFNDLKAFPIEKIAQNESLWTFILYLGNVVIFGTFLGYILIAYSQKRIRPTIVSMYVNIQPVLMLIVTIYWGLGTI